MISMFAPKILDFDTKKSEVTDRIVFGKLVD